MRRLGIALVAALTLAGAALLVPGQAFASARASIPGSRPAWATANAFRGNAPGGGRIGFRVYLDWRADPSSLIRAVTTPGSPQYGHYLTPAQFRAQFAPSTADVQAVQQWLGGQHLHIDYTPSNNLYVAADGTVAQANAAFATTLGDYQVGDQQLRAPETTPSVPAGLPQVNVVGLDD
ncbi:MAG: serine protease, partial [Candidatus Dormibacteraeota bacterium]|nr:serine protease [Candidatus Dormibacteraeota bacterium]